MTQSIKVEKTVTIQRSPEELYHFWHDFENLPRFMKHLKAVKVFDAKRSHWATTSPLGGSIEWDAEIVEEQQNEWIRWTSVEGADVANSGSVRFKPNSHNRGTVVKVITEYHPPAGAIGDAISKLFGEAPEQQLGDDLRRFKMIMETGEIATTEGQSKGRS